MSDFFTFKREIRTEERLFEVIPTVPKLQLRFRMWGDLNTGGVPDLRVWFWNEGGVTKWTYLHSGLMGRAELREKLLAYGAREFKNENQSEG